MPLDTLAIVSIADRGDVWLSVSPMPDAFVLLDAAHAADARLDHLTDPISWLALCDAFAGYVGEELAARGHVASVAVAEPAVRLHVVRSKAA